MSSMQPKCNDFLFYCLLQILDCGWCVCVGDKFVEEKKMRTLKDISMASTHIEFAENIQTIYNAYKLDAFNRCNEYTNRLFTHTTHENPSPFPTNPDVVFFWRGLSWKLIQIGNCLLDSAVRMMFWQFVYTMHVENTTHSTI